MGVGVSASFLGTLDLVRALHFMTSPTPRVTCTAQYLPVLTSTIQRKRMELARLLVCMSLATYSQGELLGQNACLVYIKNAENCNTVSIWCRAVERVCTQLRVYVGESALERRDTSTHKVQVQIQHTRKVVQSYMIWYS